MTLTVDQLYQQIGQAAVDLADDLAGKLVIYAEVEDGAISADVFYVRAAGDVRFRFAPRPIKELIYSFWELWKEQPDNQEWRTMSYVVDSGRLNIDLSYPDQIDSREALNERRPVVIKKHFGNMSMDYSTP